MEVNWGNVESYSEVQSVNGLTGKVQLNIPTKTSDLINDSGFVSNSNFATKTELKEVENKIPNVSNFATKSDVSNSISEVEKKIPSVANLATKQELTAVENKIPNVSNLATTSYVETAITNKGQQTQTQVQALINDAISNIKNANEVSY